MESQKILDTDMFSHIKDFVQVLNDNFGSAYYQLKLYNHLLSKISSNKEEIDHQQKIFISFITKNKTAILNQQYSLIKDKISYSSKIYIDIQGIFSLCEKDNNIDAIKTICQHLLAILADTNDTDALESLKKSLIDTKTNEGNVLSDIMSVVEKNIPKDNTDPVEAFSSILKSGAIQDIVKTFSQKINNGSLDLTKMFGMVQGMMSGLSANSSTPSNSPISSLEKTDEKTIEKDTLEK